MEKWVVVGFKKVDFKDEKANKQISGYSLFLTREGAEDVIGEECQKIFVSDQRVDYVPQVGDEIKLVYNRFGKVGDIVYC